MIFDNIYLDKLWDKLGDKFLDGYYNNSDLEYDMITDSFEDDLESRLEEAGYKFEIGGVDYIDDYGITIIVDVSVESGNSRLKYIRKDNRQLEQEIELDISIGKVDNFRFWINTVYIDEDKDIDTDEQLDSIIEEYMEELDEEMTDLEKMDFIMYVKKELENIQKAYSIISSFKKDCESNLHKIQEEYMRDEFLYYLEDYNNSVIAEIEYLQNKNLEVQDLYRKYLDSKE